MSRTSSIPPLALEAKQSFTRAVEILSERNVQPLRRFPAEAVEIRRLANNLSLALEEGLSLKSIDELAMKLSSKCLELQTRTLKVRGEGGR